MNLRRLGYGIQKSVYGVQKSVFALRPALESEKEVLDQDTFQRRMSLERKRAERSQKSFLLMLIDAGSAASNPLNSDTLHKVVSLIFHLIRETDLVGWYKADCVVGAMFTDIAKENRNAVIRTIVKRVNSTLHELLPEKCENLNISFHVFPEEWHSQHQERLTNPKLYPDLNKRDDKRKFRRITKRAMDIFISLLVLSLGSPVFLLIALAIKLTSKGPVFYRQQRVGQYGVLFSFLKFRSMYQGNDASVHKEYVRQLIAGIAPRQPVKNNGETVYKLTQDKRVTAVGAFLRRSSLDELPQFINVLMGDMSLVGPRPPIDYELENYEVWHRRRVVEAKPGITGLWQVNGRNRINFDEMVRLDLKYAKCWSAWLDLKILLRTPKAMIEGAH